MVHCGKWDWCIVEFVQQAYYNMILHAAGHRQTQGVVYEPKKVKLSNL